MSFRPSMLPERVASRWIGKLDGQALERNIGVTACLEHML